MRKSEDRLRVLHPHAMARYDRLRADGMSPLDAMRDTAPLFSRSPAVRVGDPGPARPVLTASPGQDATSPASQSPSIPDEAEPATNADDSAEQRGREIIARMQSSARAAKRPELNPDELAMVLESATNLPHNVIDRITREAAAGNQASSQLSPVSATTRDTDLTAAGPAADVTDGHVTAEVTEGDQTRRTDPHSDWSAAQLAAENFPASAADAVRTASTAKSQRHARPAPAPSAPSREIQGGGPHRDR